MELPEPNETTKREILAPFLNGSSSKLPAHVLAYSLTHLVPAARRAQRRAHPQGDVIKEMIQLCESTK